MATYSFITLDDPSATNGTFAQAINDSGEVVGYYDGNSSTSSSFIYTEGNYTTGKGFAAEGVNNNAVYTYQQITNIPAVGFRNQSFTSASGSFLGFGGQDANNYVYGINNSGVVVGYYTNDSNPAGFIESGGSPQTIVYPGASATQAHGINDQNQVVGYFIGTDPNQPSVSTAHGFFYNNGAFAFFDDPNAVNGTFAEGINNADQIVGYYLDGNGFSHGFVFNKPAGTYTTVDVPGAVNTYVYGINNENQLAGYYVDGGGKTHSFVATPPNPTPPAATTAVMIMDQPTSGKYEIYDIGNNAVLAAYPLATASSPWQAVDVGGFDGSDTSDLLLRNSSTGAFELFDVSGNNANGPVSLGSVGIDWSVLGFGDFSGNPGETDMLMRQNGTAKLEAYDISNNQITGAASMGAVGPEWQFLGVGDFSSNANETDLLMRDVNNGALEVYNINHNAIVSATAMGAVGLEWQFVGVGNFSGNSGETDMLMRDKNNGALEVYNVHNDQIVGAQAMGAVGLEWSPVGIGDFSGNPGETDMIMRDGNTGAFEIYDISHDSVVSASSIGAVGTDWQAAGIAAYQTGSAAIASSGDQLPDAAPNADPFTAGSFGGASAQDLPQIANFMQPSSGFSSALPAAGTPIGGDLAAMLSGAPQQPHA